MLGHRRTGSGQPLVLITSRPAPRAERRLPGARHVRLDGCGHVPMWDDPGEVARVVLDASAALSDSASE